MPDLDQHHFDHLLPCKPMLRVQEVADLLQVSGSTVEKLIETGQLPSLNFNGGRGIRMSLRIPREGFVLLLLRNKTYDVKDYISSILALLATLSAAELVVIRDQLPSLTARAVARQPASPQPIKRK